MICKITYAKTDDTKVVAILSLTRNRVDDPEVWHIISQKTGC